MITTMRGNLWSKKDWRKQFEGFILFIHYSHPLHSLSHIFPHTNFSIGSLCSSANGYFIFPMSIPTSVTESNMVELWPLVHISIPLIQFNWRYIFSFPFRFSSIETVLSFLYSSIHWPILLDSFFLYSIFVGQSSGHWPFKEQIYYYKRKLIIYWMEILLTDCLPIVYTPDWCIQGTESSKYKKK